MDSKKRPVRPSALRAQNIVTNGGFGGYTGGSGSEEEDEPMGRPAPRATRRQPKVDFGKLDTLSLQRYRKNYKLGDAPPTSQKEDLIPAVARHFASQVVDEDETLLRFAIALRKHSQQTRMGGGPPIKKPRNGPIVKPKPQR